MPESDIRINPDELKTFTKEVFVKLGVSPDDAGIESEHLVWANLRGVDSHGVLRIPYYVDQIEQGIINPNPKISVKNETPATILVDGDMALGPVVTTKTMTKVIEKAKNIGVGWGILRNTTHQGCMGYYSMMASETNMAGIAVVCSPPNMAPHGAKAAGTHNAPISIAVPGEKYPSLVIDMATSVAAGGKVKLAADKGISIPLGWALDQDGNPSTDPNSAPILLPFGGPKGSGLAIMFECLTGIMAGNPLQSPVLMGKRGPEHGPQNGFLAAIDIATFTDVHGYKKNVDDLIDGIKGLPKADGVDEIFVPGEPEGRVYLDRSENGIPLPGGTISKLKDVAGKLSIQVPSNM